MQADGFWLYCAQMASLPFPGAGQHVILGKNAFGTPGMGGSIGFADTDARMSFGYVMNRHGAGVGLNERGQGLIDAAYRSLGFTSSAPGFWVRE